MRTGKSCYVPCATLYPNHIVVRELEVRLKDADASLKPCRLMHAG